MKAILDRYKKYSEQYEKERRRISDWMNHLAIGQYPYPFYKALGELSTFKKRKITPLWKQIRNRITEDGKTLWQHFPFATDDEPPLFREITPFLEIEKEKPKI